MVPAASSLLLALAATASPERSPPPVERTPDGVEIQRPKRVATERAEPAERAELAEVPEDATAPLEGPADWPPAALSWDEVAPHPHVSLTREPPPPPPPPPPPWPTADHHGFAWDLDFGVSTIIGVPDAGAIPNGRVSMFFGGSLPRRGGRKLALGAVAEVDFFLLFMHRHHLAIDGQAGRKGRFYYRVHAGLSAYYATPTPGIGARIGAALHLRRSDFILGASVNADLLLFPIPMAGVFFGVMRH